MEKFREEAVCKILVTSDVHGFIYPTDYRTSEERPFGLAKLATLIRHEREQTPGLLLVDNGDIIQGTPLCTFYVKNDPNGVHPSIAALNLLKYDAAVPGNHEFNYGQELLHKVINDSRFPWLSAGIMDIGTDEPAFGKPYIVKTSPEGVKIAILGVTTHYIPHWEHPRHIAGWTFRDALETVKNWVPRIREVEQPDLLVVSYHGGFERDLATGAATERLTGENQGYAMCLEVPGIDVLITGHQHRMIAGEVGGVTVIQPGTGGQALGKITVCFQRRADGRWTVREKTAELLVPDTAVAADREVLELVHPVESATQAWLDQPIGRVDGDMTIESPFTCRLADHPFMEFVNQVQMEAAGVNVSNAALLSEQSKGFAGGITLRDVLTNFMYPNTLTVLRLTGRDIREALEQTANYFVLGEDGAIAVNPGYLEPKAQHYNYDMWEGIEYELDVAKPVGQRVVRLTRNGAPLQDETEVEVVMNNYRAGGGGDYDMYRGKPVVREIQTDMAELVAEYIERHETIQAACNGNWRIVNSLSRL
ncbi:bifunctional metallophosphatase/5'-nucleotidase [Paenibacillus sp. MBLB2552]|uniref:Bifunctional metallophosphatase/5'-nucleotidase n=1 Tax=Paenibacillus mellifer TaxID=2937794 RepID=A0A9X2BQP7_9BACL|nr:bifunctional UDP-sugar hydrolase/5'-nucleotidase [Paenibacillus mellifer]MCK8486455.1 bifunctional metallophosphatase/5'-nucleotidase [Paenibacillus mellifer]